MARFQRMVVCKPKLTHAAPDHIAWGLRLAWKAAQSLRDKPFETTIASYNEPYWHSSLPWPALPLY